MKKNFPARDLNDRSEYRDMVEWLNPFVLLKTAKKTVDSELFGQYADRRLVHAALDSPIDQKRLIKDCHAKDGLLDKKEGEEFWVDYVADLGDGFDSTYAIAYLIGKEAIEVDDIGTKALPLQNNGQEKTVLPRADCLIMGGDQVYPDASREEYQKRMKRPYRAAFPKSERPNAPRVPVYLIPGNHDWYDGLTLFLANFCSGNEERLGSWVATQKRSYFAVHLGRNWWLWGFDSQLGEDIDKPQADYFTSVTATMDPHSKVILCASIPSWLKADINGDRKERDKYYRGIHYVAGILAKERPKSKIPLVLSGDLHHYSRYMSQEAKTNFITAGGGGAFLHPTHDLGSVIKMKWHGVSDDHTLRIANKGSGDGSDKSLYPSEEESRRLALGNILFAFRNPKFALVLWLLYTVCGLSMLSWDGYGGREWTPSFATSLLTQLTALLLTPVFVIVVLALWGILYKASELRAPSPKWREYIQERLTPKLSVKIARWVADIVAGVISWKKAIVSSLHCIGHSALILGGVTIVSMVLVPAATVYGIGDILYFFLLLIGFLLLGFVGAVIWGLYLTATSWLWGDEGNVAFSAMRLDTYRHFVRLKIEEDKLTIYPIGIKKSPQRDDWDWNPAYIDDDVDPNEPAIILKEGRALGEHLIEGPLVIDIEKVAPLKPV